MVLLALMLLKIRNFYGALVVLATGAAVALVSWYSAAIVGWLSIRVAWLFLLAAPRQS